MVGPNIVKALTLCLFAISITSLSFVAFGEETKRQLITNNFVQLELANGLKIVILRQARFPIVAHLVIYLAGSDADPPGKSGLAHYVEHLTYKDNRVGGTQTLKNTVYSWGGWQNAYTTYNSTSYFQTIPPQALRDVMLLEAKRMSGLEINASSADDERKIILNERRQQIEVEPMALQNERTRQILFLGHPYATPVIGSERDINNIAMTDVLSFYEKWYRPNNAVVLIFGDINPSVVNKMAVEIYGVVPKKNGTENIASADNLLPLQGKIRFSDRDASGASRILSMSFATESYGRITEAEVLAKRIAVAAIGGGQQSILYKYLVIDRKQALYANMYFRYASKHWGLVNVIASPRDAVSIHELELAIDSTLLNVHKNGLTREEFEVAKRLIERTIRFRLDSSRVRAFEIAEALALGVDAAAATAPLIAIEAVTYDQVNAVAKAITKENLRVVSTLNDDDLGRVSE